MDERDYAEESYVRYDADREAAAEWWWWHGQIEHRAAGMPVVNPGATPVEDVTYEYTISVDGGRTYTQVGYLSGREVIEIMMAMPVINAMVINRFVATINRPAVPITTAEGPTITQLAHELGCQPHELVAFAGPVIPDDDDHHAPLTVEQADEIRAAWRQSESDRL